MRYLKCFKKQINIVLFITIFTLGVITIIWGFTHELFDVVTYKDKLSGLQIFDKFTIKGKELDTSFTLQGLIEFVTRVVKNELNSELVTYNVFLTSNIIGASKNVIAFLVIMFVSFATFVIGQLFNFRNYTNILSSLLMLVFIILIKNVALNNFVEIEFVKNATSAITTIIVLSSITFGLSLVQLGFNVSLKLVK